MKDNKSFRDKSMTAVTNSSPGNVDTSDWFSKLSSQVKIVKRSKLSYE